MPSDLLLKKIQSAHWALAAEIRRLPATSEQLEAFEREFGPIPADYRWYLSVCGGGVAGSEWLDGIDELSETQRKFLRESSHPRGYTMKDVFVFGWDGFGNPMAISLDGGEVIVEDHDFGGVHAVADSFIQFLCDLHFKKQSRR